MNKGQLTLETQQDSPAGGSMSHAWRALRHRNFKLFFFGQSISMIGTWMTRLATSWLVYRLTHSALLLGMVSFAGQIVAFAAGPFAGVWVERRNRRNLLVWTQAAAAAQSLALAVLILAHVITLWEIIVLAAFQGLINAFDMPARQSFLVQMVEDRRDLSNAIAINSSMANGARLIGPAIGGMVIAAFGEGWCVLIDGISYFAVIASLLLMCIQYTEMRSKARSMFGQIRESWDDVRKFRPIRAILVLFALTSLMGFPYGVLLPVFAGQVLHGGAHTLGWLHWRFWSGSAGFGNFAGGTQIGRRVDAYASAGYRCVGRGADSLWHVAHLLAIPALDGFCRIRLGPERFREQHDHSIPGVRRQTRPSDGYYTMAFFGAAPLGSLLAGTLAQLIGAPCTVILTGTFCLACSIWFGLELPKVRAVMRPIYQEMGILPRSGIPLTPPAQETAK